MLVTKEKNFDLGSVFAGEALPLDLFVQYAVYSS